MDSEVVEVGDYMFNKNFVGKKFAGSKSSNEIMFGLGHKVYIFVLNERYAQASGQSLKRGFMEETQQEGIPCYKVG
eukprot:snap_masked-scaffold_39-processed-gene-1.30-mRNA-1 protein AED:1.00 eAED:1.00 QI:0/-1/0/0/-1/1/1/0/75